MTVARGVSMCCSVYFKQGVQGAAGGRCCGGGRALRGHWATGTMALGVPGLVRRGLMMVGVAGGCGAGCTVLDRRDLEAALSRRHALVL